MYLFCSQELQHFAAYVTNLHTLEHKGAYGEDKFYLRPTNHVTVHGGAIPIQQPPQVASNALIIHLYFHIVLVFVHTHYINFLRIFSFHQNYNLSLEHLYSRSMFKLAFC